MNAAVRAGVATVVVGGLELAVLLLGAPRP
jgi:hypothetical protein